MSPVISRALVLLVGSGHREASRAGWVLGPQPAGGSGSGRLTVAIYFTHGLGKNKERNAAVRRISDQQRQRIGDEIRLHPVPGCSAWLQTVSSTGLCRMTNSPLSVCLVLGRVALRLFHSRLFRSEAVAEFGPGGGLQRPSGGDSKFQVEPELRFRAKPVPKAQGCIARDRALAVDDLAHPVGWHIDLACEFRRRDSQFFQFILENLTWPSFHELARLALVARLATRNRAAIVG